MIQRIQSIYLLIATILLASVFAYPFAEILSSDGHLFIFKFSGLTIENEAGMYLLTVPPIILLSISTLLSFFSIFFYNQDLCLF